MKKLLSILLCVLLLVCSLALSSSAVSYNASMGELRAQFEKGYGPNEDGMSTDYSYYSPVKGENDNNKYPVVIIFPGFGEGSYPGEELTGNDFPLWSSEELQSRFTNGGAYILIMRANENMGITWNETRQLQSAKAAVDDFISKNPNTDRSKIYCLGWSFGGTGSMNFAIKYPNFIAGAIVIAACVSFSAADMKRLENTAVWIFQSKNDGLALASYGNNTWNNLKAATKHPSNIRYTTAEKAPNASTAIGHAMWLFAKWDTDRELDKYTGLKTIDGTGATIELDESSSIIRWLTSKSLNYTENASSCKHDCHKSGITGFFWKIGVFFYKLFNISDKRVCECGISHW